MKKEPLGWRILAKLLAKPFIRGKLIRFAMKRPYFDIYKNGKLYMRRWWLVPSFALYPHPKHKWLDVKPWWPFRWRIHHIASPDSDERYHDHPSGYRSFILSGDYVEVSPDKLGRFPSNISKISTGKAILFRAGETVSRKAADWHSIVAVASNTFTLFCMSNKPAQEWGFLVHGAKVHWKTYLDQAAAARLIKENPAWKKYNNTIMKDR